MAAAAAVCSGQKSTPQSDPGIKSWTCRVHLAFFFMPLFTAAQMPAQHARQIHSALLGEGGGGEGGGEGEGGGGKGEGGGGEGEGGGGEGEGGGGEGEGGGGEGEGCGGGGGGGAVPSDASVMISYVCWFRPPARILRRVSGPIRGALNEVG